MCKIKDYYLKKDHLQLRNLRKELESTKENAKITHLKWLCDLLIKRLEGDCSSLFTNQLSQYLIGVDEWTRYEIVLFNNCIFAFDVDLVNLLVKNISKNISFYNLYKKNNSELFQLLINVTVCNIQSFDYKQAKSSFNSAKEVFLEEDSLFEKTILLFWSGLFEILNNEEQGIAKINDALNIFYLLNSQNLFDMHKSLYDFVYQL